MAASLLWMIGLVLESVILVRFLKCKLFTHYPFFFVYMALVWSSSISLWPIYHFYFSAYPNFFWAKQFLTLLAGFGVLLEIVQKSFEKYPGAKAFATAVLVGMFVILFGYFAFRLPAAPLVSSGENLSDVERDFRAVQAIALAGVLGVIFYYRVDIGRNLRGIISGFGLYVGSVILSRALRGYAGPSLDREWSIVQPYMYLVCLMIWTAALWSYAPAQAPETPPGSDGEYGAFARRTKELLGTMRSDVGKVERQ
ncbi:MAG: hypothetical protein WB987_08990 [Candidatus Acidiferrales bacterium]